MTLRAAKTIKPGDRVYDNRAHHPLDSWPLVISVEPIAAEKVAIKTEPRLFVCREDELVLVADWR